jgi:hypothetical protein
MVAVKYTKAINFETFRSAILVDDEDQPLTQPALKMTFEKGEGSGTCLLGSSSPDEIELLRIASGTAGLQFPEETALHLMYSATDFAAGKWKLVKGRLEK